MKLSGYFRQHVTNMTLKYVKILSLRTGNMDENQFFLLIMWLCLSQAIKIIRIFGTKTNFPYL